MYGFFGKLLRVNLSKKNFVIEDLPEEILHRFLGGKGLGSWLLLRNVPAGVEALSPENKIIFTTGPAAGTGMVGSSRYGVYSKSPLTGLYGESYGGGKVAPALNKTGFDAVILEDKAEAPVYLEITETGAAFHDASRFWGQDTYAAEAGILAEVDRPGAQAVVIGPAGENLVRFACIENNRWRSAGRGGMGAVLGSKKVKGLVFYGSKKAEIFDEGALKSLIKEIRDEGKDHPGVKAYQRYGTTQMVALLNKAKAFPTRYWSQGQLPGWEKISGDSLLENFEVKPQACPNCFLTCGKLTTIVNGKHQGLTIEGPEYETLYAFGGLCLIDSLNEIAYLNDVCDRLGLDTITAGNLVALAMEAASQGKLEPGLAFGDAAGAASLLEDIAYRRGAGSIFANGIKEAGPALGMEEDTVHVKGMEPAGYDPRFLKGVGLGYATSARGACHLRGTFYKPELAGMIDPEIIDGKAALYIEFENRLTLFNSQILCVFFRDLLQWERLSRLIYATTGLLYDEDALRNMGNEIISLTRLFNLQHGLRPEDDTLPPKMLKRSLGYAKPLTEDELKQMVSDYYRLRGWDEKGRVVKRELLEIVS